MRKITPSACWKSSQLAGLQQHPHSGDAGIQFIGQKWGSANTLNAVGMAVLLLRLL